MDIGVRGFGDTPGQAFAQAALAMTGAAADLESIAPAQQVAITCESPDLEHLLLEWLNAVIRTMQTRTMLFSRFEVTIEGSTLHAHAWGEQVDRARHHLTAELKRATDAHLRVAQRPNGDWVCECVIDL